MKRSSLALLLICLIFTAGGVWAAPIDNPMVLYTLYFVRLDNAAQSSLQTSLSGSSFGATSGTWEIHSEDDYLKFAADFSTSISGQVAGELESTTTASYYTSWLVTTGRAPAGIRLEEDQVSLDIEEDEIDAGFELTLTPIEYDWPQGRVLTRSEVAYSTQAGDLAHTQTSVWVSSTPQRPVAIVAKKVKSTTSQQKEYFALYLAATLLTSADIPQDTPVISFSDLAGIQEVLGQDKAQKTAEPLKLGLTIKSNWIDVFFKGELSYPIQRELAFVTRLDNLSGTPTLRAGFTDETTLLQNVKLKATYYPAQLALDGSGFSGSQKVEGQVAYERESWGIWYKAKLDDECFRSSAGLSWELTEHYGLETEWSRDLSGASEVNLKINCQWELW